VDILHISFPCQTFSRAHTVPGRNDDANSAVWSALGPIIEHCRPRTLVLEQADGICDERHRPTLDAWIRELTSKGYSARWSILNAARWGNAHARKRLFIIASCPGEPLPAFPRPTHGAGPPLLPWVTIADRLRLLPAHQEPHMRQHRPRGGRPYTPHRPLAQCITTGGGKGDLHPDGTRTFTAQELALLNGFPPGHLFAAAGLGSLRRQIGNAVPSMVERAVLDEVIGSMRRFDEKVAAWRPEDDVMVID
jgi:DNA (cytosine-5)-methyltransferase 1